MQLNPSVFLVLPIVLLAACCSASAQPADAMAYKPDIVGVNRMFMVALRVPANVPQIKVTFPEHVTMFDRTTTHTDQKLRKYYFRALKPRYRLKNHLSSKTRC